jgi:hypothetical protein
VLKTCPPPHTSFEVTEALVNASESRLSLDSEIEQKLSK